ncbi:MAG: hypothetical protein F6J98_20775 [Moorea sp. SIO4G2]|uniref:hypothetical protein n=1 Tax=Moorena bouillonii TaxID=207920 RepID=UPI00117FB00E|nr:hypothetical protein [Moorena bouillonii]NEO46094.1 hypothetical protein [Moorena sp. SIO4A3]NEO62735.1 hypothetical protein [Moorena sp. SIO4G2]
MQRGLGGFPHERLHQDNQSTYLPLCKKPTLVRISRLPRCAFQWASKLPLGRTAPDSRLPIPDSRLP